MSTHLLRGFVLTVCIDLSIALLDHTIHESGLNRCRPQRHPLEFALASIRKQTDWMKKRTCQKRPQGRSILYFKKSERSSIEIYLRPRFRSFATIVRASLRIGRL